MIDKIQIDTNYFDTFGLSLIMIDKIQIIYSNITVDGARVVSLPRRLSSLQDMEGNRVFSLCIYCSVLWTMFVPFVLTIVVSVLLRFTTFDYPFKLVLFDMQQGYATYSCYIPLFLPNQNTFFTRSKIQIYFYIKCCDASNS